MAQMESMAQRGLADARAGMQRLEVQLEQQRQRVPEAQVTVE